MGHNFLALNRLFYLNSWVYIIKYYFYVEFVHIPFLGMKAYNARQVCKIADTPKTNKVNSSNDIFGNTSGRAKFNHIPIAGPFYA